MDLNAEAATEARLLVEPKNDSPECQTQSNEVPCEDELQSMTDDCKPKILLEQSMLNEEKPISEEQQPSTKPNAQKDEENEDGFVCLDYDKYSSNDNDKPMSSMKLKKFLAVQIEKCDRYTKLFKQQNDITMANKFAAYSLSTAKHLDALKSSRALNEQLPDYKIEFVDVNCVPFNVEVLEKALLVDVEVLNLPATKGSQTYIIAEFGFPIPKDEPILTTFTRWFIQTKIEPKNVLCSSSDEPRQLDIVYSTSLLTSAHGDYVEYQRPLRFLVEKGKSRTLKRKFKPVKITFYEKTSFIRRDKKLGSVQINVDAINDEATIKETKFVMDGRKKTKAIAHIKVKVREPLVEKSSREHQESLILSV